MKNNRIIQLDEKTIHLISAGEVVESPSSIVKELVENSIDADSSAIVIEIKDGGKTYIRVTDDGHGIEERDSELAFQRHTTSKIKSFDDFDDLHTNGFRGEALGSISAVSKVNLISKTRENLFGVNLLLEGGNLLSKSKIGAKDGTTLIVEELFFNTPARRKFLKSNQGETSRITDIIIQLALANPSIKFKYINNNKVMLTTSGNSFLYDAINSIYDDQFREGLVEIDTLMENIKIKGYLGKNTLMFSSRRNQHLFVNSRVVRGKEIIASIEKAYSKFIPSGNFPAFMLDIIVPPSIVDVNIHPNKLDIKFGKDYNIPEIVGRVVQEKLDSLVMIPRISISPSKNNTDASKEEKIIKNISLDEILPDLEYNTISTDKQFLIRETAEEISQTPKMISSEVSYNAPVSKKEEEKKIYKNEKIRIDHSDENSNYEVNFDYKRAKMIGVIFDTYFIAEMNSSMYLIDQHAAHERILYEKYLDSLEKEDFHSQTLLVPVNIKLPMILEGEEENLVNYLLSKGFIADLFGERNIALRGIPNIFSIDQGVAFVEEIINITTKDIDKFKILDDKIAMKACKAAIKAHDKLNPKEINNILEELSDCRNKYSCPHGRPIIVEISNYEIEKMFKRVLK